MKYKMCNGLLLNFALTFFSSQYKGLLIAITAITVRERHPELLDVKSSIGALDAAKSTKIGEFVLIFTVSVTL